MDKYIKVFCKQNPIISIICHNPECSCEFKVKSEEFFKENIYKQVCENCGKSSEYDTSIFVKEFISYMKKLGVEVK